METQTSRGDQLGVKVMRFILDSFASSPHRSFAIIGVAFEVLPTIIAAFIVAGVAAPAFLVPRFASAAITRPQVHKPLVAIYNAKTMLVKH